MKRIFLRFLFTLVALIIIALVFWVLVAGLGQNVPADALKI
jgi:hypothetical protein